MNSSGREQQSAMHLARPHLLMLLTVNCQQSSANCHVLACSISAIYQVPSEGQRMYTSVCLRLVLMSFLRSSLYTLRVLPTSAASTATSATNSADSQNHAGSGFMHVHECMVDIMLLEDARRMAGSQTAACCCCSCPVRRSFLCGSACTTLMCHTRLVQHLPSSSYFFTFLCRFGLSILMALLL